MSTIGQRLSRSQRQKITDAVAEKEYGGGSLFAPLQFKADPEDEVDAFLKPVKFRGFANVGGPDLGGDIVDPRAFSRATLNEYLKFGRQLFFMHSRMEQVGEITKAEQVLAGKRSLFGIADGGLMVEGFVDTPFDTETGMIPDHPLAKIIHFARMQVKRNRLKLLSIGWRPVKTEFIKAKDPRRGNQEFTFRLVKSLILGEVSLVTMAMSPRSMVELQKAYTSAYGEEIAGALFAEDGEGSDANIPENVDGFTIEHLKELAEVAGLRAIETQRKEQGDDETEAGKEERRADDLQLISLKKFQQDDDSGRLVLTSLKDDKP